MDFWREKYSKMPRAKKNFVRLQEYNKRRQLSFDEKEKTETNENTESVEREEKGIELEEKTRTCLFATALIWNKPEKNKRTIKGIPKTTYYRKFGTSSILANASKGTPKITSFWGSSGSAGGSFVLSEFSASSNSCISELTGSSPVPSPLPFPSPSPSPLPSSFPPPSPSSFLPPSPSSFPSPSPSFSSPSPSSFSSPSPSSFSSLVLPALPGSLSKTNENSILCERIAQLRDDLIKNGKMLTVFEYNRQRAVYEYLIRVNDGNGKMKASEEVTQMVYIISKPYTAKWIRSMAKFYLNHQSFPVSCRGKHQKYHRLVDDEDIALRLRQWLRQESGSNGIDVVHFKQYIEDFILPERIETRKTISIRTAERWLHILGYRFEGYRKGIYFDGHEREDVVIYRKEFLKIMKELEQQMARYEGEEMEVIPPVLKPDERELILVTHDECIFYANDGKKRIWVDDGEMPLRKKGNGRSIMVSEFLSEACGRLKLSEEEIERNPDIPIEARCYLLPGKNQEGYWTFEHLLEQIKSKAIPIFEAKFPNATAVFAFDNSTNHAAYAKDALVAARMNLGPGGKQPIMRLTSFIDKDGREITQQMVFSEDYSDPTLQGKPKGIKRILQERGLWKEGLNLECLMCKKKESLRVDCCARKIMASQPDFVAQKSAIVELIENAGHLCVFYPKFHCELNFIEMYWGAAKHYARDHCDYTWVGLQETVPQALDSVNITTIRKYARKSWRYMQLYREGLTGKLAEYACKKFKSHRRIPQDDLTAFIKEKSCEKGQ